MVVRGPSLLVPREVMERSTAPCEQLAVCRAESQLAVMAAMHRRFIHFAAAAIAKRITAHKNAGDQPVTPCWDVANVRRVRLLALPGAVGDASDCSDAPTARAGLASGTP